ncbi:hypothetical protein IMAU10142_01696 [Lactobacillus helveticus]|uniref:type II toxin-antitoxin system RelE/ParE family toxin n=1 Tax=Lactobacillus helveticus TaxID=1587 RepID=UPI001562D867|nr:type II toxin-antitoxin system RelE/ParE family toxin [Lactobacillus helveticus]NRO27291.1 hypothetical protein [Lactobacillus helveticus]NRO76778.1 hypothetical protein [Lactobacillus helveticus]NRO85086.1 hypothetical protein [Lactobacillus helveticus]NRO91666.1 hypothetical protein [Lactobacillus helveticus]
MEHKIKFMYTKVFMRHWFECDLNLDDRKELEDGIIRFIQEAPVNNHGHDFPGAIMQDTGGAVKYRFTSSKSNKGKSGSYRTIYFTFDDQAKLFLFFDVYPKSKKESLTNRQKKMLKKFSKDVKLFVKRGND